MSEQSNSWRVAEATPSWHLSSGDFLDVNVWLILSYRSHELHAAASRYWQSACESGTPLWFSRGTMMGLVRLLMQPRVMGPDVMTIHQALDIYRNWLDTPQVALLPETPGFDEALVRLMGSASAPLPSRLWTDLCFASTAEASGLRMVTFDRDFERFGLTRCLVLPTDANTPTDPDSAP
jgi:toxin-antitoxin system PIN domain toxin